MTAIAASSVSLKTMMDGTLRISFDFEPTQAQDAFRLFAAPGTQVAIAALKAGTYIEQQATQEKPKGGELARLAGIWCNEPKFWRWMNQAHGAEVDNDMAAAVWIRQVCDVGSRVDLDHNEAAASYFHEAIRLPYMDYLRTDS